MSMTNTAAQKLLGMKPNEISSVVHVPEGGVVITTAAGPQYIVVPDDQPDGAGRTGLMLYREPKPGALYRLPIFTPRPPVEVSASYGDLKHAELVELIEARNADRSADEQLVAKGSKAALVEVLEADDAEAEADDA